MFASKDELFTRPSGGYTIARSVRLRSSASAYFNRTFGSPTNNKKWTVSAWVKRGILGANETLFSANSSQSNYFDFRFNTSDQIYIQNRVGASNLLIANTTAVYRDPSAWYHIVFAFDSANATAANRNLLYVNNVNVSLSANSSLNDASSFNVSGYEHDIGGSQTLPGLWATLDGYVTEFNFIDGQALTPSSFGSTNAITGVWQPAKYTGTYGTNGFYLNFSDNSNNTATTIGKDYSGNANNWTPNNISVTAGATYDSMTDVPTLTSATAANYAVLNPLVTGSYVTLSNANLKTTGNTATDNGNYRSTIAFTTGKWYLEMTCSNDVGGTNNPRFGILPVANASLPDNGGTNSVGSVTNSAAYQRNGQKYVSGATSSYGATFTTGDVIGAAIDADNGTLVFYKNGTSQGTAFTWTGGSITFVVAGSDYNGSASSYNFGQQPFVYTPPTGYVALNTFNLPDSTIKNGAGYMAATTYTGNGGTQAVANTTGSTSFQPDLVWVKSRSAAYSNWLNDSVRGAGTSLSSNLTDADTNYTAYFTSFATSGFNLAGGSNAFNASATTYVAWQWKAGTTSSSNTNGSITSTVSVGATQGFSVATYTGNGTAGATFGHGLGVTPAMIIIKARTSTSAENWFVYHQNLTAVTYYLRLNSTNAQTDGGSSGATSRVTAISSSVITLGPNTEVNESTKTYVAYCFSAVKGYSAFGSYTGNGSTDGPFVYTGFRPRFILTKDSSAVGNWFIQDTSRGTYNAVGNSGSPDSPLAPNTSGSETDWNGTFSMDILSNGFKLRNTAASMNTSGDTYIYAAFAENPFKNALAR
jgi:hypothetical protein